MAATIESHHSAKTCTSSCQALSTNLANSRFTAVGNQPTPTVSLTTALSERKSKCCSGIGNDLWQSFHQCRIATALSTTGGTYYFVAALSTIQQHHNGFGFRCVSSSTATAATHFAV